TLRGDAEKCIAAGMDAYIAKPFSKAQLYDLLHRQLLAKPGHSDAVVTALVAKPAIAVINHDVLQEMAGIESPDGSNLAETILKLYLDTSRKELALLDEGIQSRN